MRASFMLLGPLLSRFGRVIISNPGGDRIGRRPVDLHVEAMRTLGATIEYRNGYYFATAPGRLRGTEIRFPFVSVMGTENAMLAATLADGHTVIRPAAQRARGRRPDRLPPEDGRRGRADLSRHDRGRRASAACAAPSTTSIAGPDRGRHVRDRRRRHRRPGDAHRRAVRPHDRVPRGPRAGRRRRDRAKAIGSRSTAGRSRDGGFRACDIETAPYPGLATDLQPPDLGPADAGRRARRTSTRRSSRTASSGSRSCSRMGARIDIVDNHHATIHGRTPLRGADVEIGDLRAGASLILAALAADGESTIHGAHHVQRGYENIERKFTDLGARIARLEQKGLSPPPHEDRHRPRHGQRPRLRQGQGSRHHRAVRGGRLRRQPDRRRRRGGPRDDRPDARQHHRPSGR